MIRHRHMTASDVGERLGWHVTDYGIERTWQDSYAGDGIIVGIADTGIDEQHATVGDLKDSILNIADFSGSRRSGPRDVQGHGTHVAGIVAARWGNNIGLGGVAPRSRLLIGKCLGDDGSGDDRGVANALVWMCEGGALVGNCSLGSSVPSQILREACEYCASRGMLIFCATGNDGARDGVDYPGAYPSTCGVGAVDRRKQLARFSDRGPQVDLVAPGVRILSLYLNGGYAELSGTSMATPWMAGLAANLLSFELARYGEIRTRTMADFLAQISVSSEDLGGPGKDTEYGLGVPTPLKLLRPSEPDPTDPTRPNRIGDFDVYHPATFAGKTGMFIAGRAA